MAQRISRAKRRIAGLPLDQPGDSRPCCACSTSSSTRGTAGDVDLAGEAIRIARQLVALTDDPEVAGLLALMLLHHARRASRTGAGGGWCRSPSRTGRAGTPA